MIQATLLSLLLLLASVSRLEASVSGCPAEQIEEVNYSLGIDLDTHGQTCDDAEMASMEAYVTGELIVLGFSAVDGSTFALTEGCGSRKLYVDGPRPYVYRFSLNYGPGFAGGLCQFCPPEYDDRRLGAENDAFEDFFAPQFQASVEASLNENLPLLFACVAADGVEVTVTVTESDSSC